MVGTARRAVRLIGAARRSRPTKIFMRWIYSLSLRFKRSHVDGETVFHIGLEQSFVSFIDFLDRDHFDISGDVVCATKVEHLLCFGDATDGRACETAASHDETECRNSQWF